MIDNDNQLWQVFNLIVVIGIAIGAILLLLRLSKPASKRTGDMIIGYPPHLFPAHALTRSGPLAALAATQTRLTSVYQQLPAQSEVAIWLRTFLGELREIMDTAYRVAVITQVYGQSTQLERLAAEVQQIEQQIASHVTSHLLSRDADAYQEVLNGRLEALRMCANELSALVSQPNVHS